MGKLLPAVFLFARQMPGFRHFYFASGRTGIAAHNGQAALQAKFRSQAGNSLPIPLPRAGNGLSAPALPAMIIEHMAKKRKSEGETIT
ncbi:MAG: hypothetical protein LBO03_02380 [Acidaminococcales bacterium]|nr:hypothetical protein [Acidaminococcales bacterium]